MCTVHVQAKAARPILLHAVHVSQCIGVSLVSPKIPTLLLSYVHTY